VEDSKVNILETQKTLVFIVLLELFIKWLVLHQKLCLTQLKNGEKWAENHSINMILYQCYMVVSDLFKQNHSMIVLLFQNASLLLLILLLLLTIWFKTLEILWMVHHGLIFLYITQFISMVTWPLPMNTATSISTSHNFKCF